jgi:MFS family permease
LRLAFRINYVGFAFFIPYGTERLAYAGPGGLAVLGGILVAAMKASRVAASALWGRLADRLGSRTTLVAAGALQLAAILLALLAPLLPRAFEVPIPGLDRGFDLPLCTYLLAMGMLAAGLAGNMIGGHRLLITNAPPHRRASYVAFLNTVTSPLTLLPLAGAYLAATAGMGWLFAAVASGGVLAVYGAVRMEPDRPPARAG